MKIAIIGIGAMGGLVAARLIQNTSYEVHLLARSNYYAIKQQGIKISGFNDEIVEIEPKSLQIYNDIKKLPKSEIIILTTRVNRNKELLPDLLSLCHEETKIISLQNGISFEDEITSVLLSYPLYSGTCWIKATALTPTHIRHDFGNSILLGNYIEKHADAKINLEIKKVFQKAKFEITLVDNIKSVQLTKLALNVPIFIIALQENKSVLEVVSDEVLDKQREVLQAEIIHASARLEIPIDESLIKTMIFNLKKMPGASKTDENFFNRIREELPENAGALISYVKKFGIQLPNLEKRYRDLF